MKKYKFKVDKAFSNDGLKVIEAKKGEEHELTDYLAKAFLESKVIEGSKQKKDKEQKQEQEITSDESEVDLMAIFNEDPERLTVPELKEVCQELGVKFHHASKEAKLISLIKEKIEE